MLNGLPCVLKTGPFYDKIFQVSSMTKIIRTIFRQFKFYVIKIKKKVYLKKNPQPFKQESSLLGFTRISIIKLTLSDNSITRG